MAEQSDLLRDIAESFESVGVIRAEYEDIYGRAFYSEATIDFIDLAKARARSAWAELRLGALRTDKIEMS